jgi:hypothetical protein
MLKNERKGIKRYDERISTNELITGNHESP